MLRTIRYSLVFESPLLISSTASLPGVYDRITTLDRGLPYVPASSVRGRVKDAIRSFLRDNCHSWDRFTVCEGQDPPVTDAEREFLYCPEDNPCTLCRIFGAPGGLKRGFDFSGAYYSEDAVRHLKVAFGTDVDNLSAASLSRRARNRRDDAKRRTREDHLFVDGVAETMAALEGTVRETTTHLRYDQDTRTFDYRLLLLGLRLTTELGATRNRGYGSCEFHPTDGTDWIKEIQVLLADWGSAQKGGT
jgi:CRISPR/Cas system CSM-associated protein Csm3 (group 7 of RAMP superfamily)